MEQKQLFLYCFTLLFCTLTDLRLASHGIENYLQYNYKLDAIDVWDAVVGFDFTVSKFLHLCRKMPVFAFSQPCDGKVFWFDFHQSRYSKKSSTAPNQTCCQIY